MFGHVKDEALMDVLEGAGDERAARHLESCGSCGARLSDARRGWELARQADVPDPGPVYWEAFQRGIDRRIRDERTPARGFSWRLWPAMAATAAAGLVVAVTLLDPGVRPPTGPAVSAGRVVPAWTPAVDLASGDPFEAAVDEAALGADCRDLTECLIELSAEDATVLAELLEGGVPEGRP